MEPISNYPLTDDEIERATGLIQRAKGLGCTISWNLTYPGPQFFVDPSPSETGFVHPMRWEDHDAMTLDSVEQYLNGFEDGRARTHAHLRSTRAAEGQWDPIKAFVQYQLEE